MSCPDNSRRTFVLNLNLNCGNCGGCVKKVNKIVRNIQGVDSIDIEREKGVSTISGKVDPHKVIKELKGDMGINAELVREEKSLPEISKQVLQIHGARDSIDAEQRKATVSGEEETLPKINKQERQIVSPQNPVRKILDHRRVAPQSPDFLIKPIDEPKAITIDKWWYPKHEHEHEHEHKMELKSCTKPFNCNGCMEKGFKWRYRCEPCDHDRHKECVSLEPTITPKLYEGSTFVLSQKTGHICDVCVGKIYGYSYNCEEKNLDLHPRCANLEGKLCIGGTDFVLQEKVKGKCLWCKKKRLSYLEDDEVQGWCYVSKHNKFYCHVYCVSQMVHEAWMRGDLNRKNDEEDDDASMVLERLDLKPLTNLKRSGGGGAFLKKVCIFLRTILGILFGDPTALLLTMLVEVASK